MQVISTLLLFCNSVFWILTETVSNPRSHNACVLKNQIVELLQKNQHLFNDGINISLPVSINKKCWKADLEIFMNASKIINAAVTHKLNDSYFKDLVQAIYYNLKEIWEDSLMPGCAIQGCDCEDATFPLTQFVQRLTSFLKSIPLCLSKLQRSKMD